MRVAVAGGTGLVGRYVVSALSEAGHEPVVLARAHGVDITTGAGLDDALVGVDTVIDVSNTASRKTAKAFFTGGSHQLVDAGHRAGVRHHVALSIVGIDGIRFGYYEAKVAQEEVLLAADVPVSILRATQFHEFAGQLLDGARGPIAVVPQMQTQPIAAVEVAQALVELASGGPVGRAPDLAGPEVRQLSDLARQVLRARGSKRILWPIRLPGSAGKAMRGGSLLPAGSGPRGRETFEQWLARSESSTARA